MASVEAAADVICAVQSSTVCKCGIRFNGCAASAALFGTKSHLQLI